MEDLRKHQLEAVEALRNVDEICLHNNIRYFLIAGSTLGAVRHKGFIPWDDDIDIGMQIPEYKKFISVVKESLDTRYEWLHPESGSRTANLSGRVMLGEEQLITVFPIVKLGDRKYQKISQWAIRKIVSPIYQRKLHRPLEKNTVKKKFAYVVSSCLSIFFTEKSALNVLRWNEERFEKQDTVWSCNIYSKYSLEKESIKNEWIKEIVWIPFEDGEYPVLKNYDAYLTHLYGDYMTPPPESKRHPEHID